mgnify:CR=1 FL=1
MEPDAFTPASAPSEITVEVGSVFGNTLVSVPDAPDWLSNLIYLPL